MGTSLIPKLPENRTQTRGIWKEYYPRNTRKSFPINALWNDQGRRLLHTSSTRSKISRPRGVRFRGARSRIDVVTLNPERNEIAATTAASDTDKQQRAA